MVSNILLLFIVVLLIYPYVKPLIEFFSLFIEKPSKEVPTPNNFHERMVTPFTKIRDNSEITNPVIIIQEHTSWLWYVLGFSGCILVIGTGLIYFTPIVVIIQDYCKLVTLGESKAQALEALIKTTGEIQKHENSMFKQDMLLNFSQLTQGICSHIDQIKEGLQKTTLNTNASNEAFHNINFQLKDVELQLELLQGAFNSSLVVLTAMRAEILKFHMQANIPDLPGLVGDYEGLSFYIFFLRLFPQCFSLSMLLIKRSKVQGIQEIITINEETENQEKPPKLVLRLRSAIDQPSPDVDFYQNRLLAIKKRLAENHKKIIDKHVAESNQINEAFPIEVVADIPSAITTIISEPTPTMVIPDPVLTELQIEERNILNTLDGINEQIVETTTQLNEHLSELSTQSFLTRLTQYAIMHPGFVLGTSSVALFSFIYLARHGRNSTINLTLPTITLPQAESSSSSYTLGLGAKVDFWLSLPKSIRPNLFSWFFRK